MDTYASDIGGGVHILHWWGRVLSAVFFLSTNQRDELTLVERHVGVTAAAITILHPLEVEY